MVVTVVKRDGREEEFRKEKIKDAVSKAFNSVDGSVSDDAVVLAEKISDEISNAKKQHMSVEDIQDIVRQIERWYGVTCVLQVNKRSRYTFSGSFNRDDSLKSILDMFSFSGELEIHMRQDSVFITDKIKK